MPQIIRRIKYIFPDISNTKLETSDDKILLLSNVIPKAKFNNLMILDDTSLLYRTLFAHLKNPYLPEELV